jgi:hypothetical protein
MAGRLLAFEVQVSGGMDAFDDAIPSIGHKYLGIRNRCMRDSEMIEPNAPFSFLIAAKANAITKVSITKLISEMVFVFLACHENFEMARKILSMRIFQELFPVWRWKS